MQTKMLIDTNPYLKDAATRKRLIARSVRTSCGVEGVIKKSHNTLKIVILHRRDKKIYQDIKR